MKEVAAMLKYMYVGHAFVSPAQAVRFTVVPLGSWTSLYIFFVCRNLTRVIVMGTRAARERPVARIRWTTRRMRMDFFNS